LDPGFNQVSGSASGSRRAKYPQKQKKVKKKKLCFEVLDVLFGGLKASPVIWMSVMETSI
jgi:hypothetical protein